MRNSGAPSPSFPVRMRYVQRARASAWGLGTQPMSTAAMNSAHSGPRKFTKASMIARPTSVTTAANGTTFDCPRSSMSFEMRGEMRNIASATVDDTKPARRNEYPSSVSIVMMPMLVMYT